MDEALSIGIMYIIVTIICILILRMFWLWYWKVDRVVELLEKIESNTSKSEKVKKIKNKQSTPDNRIDCPLCHQFYEIDEIKCPHCGRGNPNN